MYFRYRKDAERWGAIMYGSFSVWYDPDEGMFYAIPN